MAVSADTLFHFTSKTALLGILETQGIWPTYSKERFDKILLDDSPFVISNIPMISFCDLRLTQLSNPSISLHSRDFGKFGLGFKKTWGTRNQISPVVYVHNSSLTSGLINTILKKARTSKEELNEELKQSLSELIKFVKPYDGHYQRGNWKRKIRRYYDEREWRFIPNARKFIVYPEALFQNGLKEELNKELKKRPLKFNSDDIKFIVIERDSDKDDVAMTIDRMRLTKSSKTDLITKIISFEEIDSDY